MKLWAYIGSCTGICSIIPLPKEKENTLLNLRNRTHRCQQEATELFLAAGISLLTVIAKTTPLWNGGVWNIP